MTQPVHRTFIIDETNDKLHIKQNDSIIVLDLQLHGEDRKRRVGIVTKSTGTLFIKRDRSEHLFRKTNSYGFNYYILKYQTSFKNIDLFDGQCYWKIPVDFILENGKFVHFNKVGFEKQVFVTLDQIEKYKIHKKENRRI